MTLNDAVKRMRGKPNTQITLTIVRKGETKPLVFTLTRAVIKIQSVKSKLIEPGYAYFRVTQFQEHTGETLATAIETLFKQNQGPMKGIVLDLRNDPGGLLNGAVAVSAAFLPKNALVVYTDGRTEDAQDAPQREPENYLRGRSKDDFLAEAAAGDRRPCRWSCWSTAARHRLRKSSPARCRTTSARVIMGTQTFGKGSVQTILPLGNNTAIKLTTARYYTPNGRSIQAKGIVPDIPLDDGSRPGRRPEAARGGSHQAPHRQRQAAPKTTRRSAAPPASTDSRRPRVRKTSDEKDAQAGTGRSRVARTTTSCRRQSRS